MGAQGVVVSGFSSAYFSTQRGGCNTVRHPGVSLYTPGSGRGGTSDLIAWMEKLMLR